MTFFVVGAALWNQGLDIVTCRVVASLNDVRSPPLRLCHFGMLLRSLCGVCARDEIPDVSRSFFWYSSR